MSRNWYYRLLFSYFPIFFLTVTILIFIAFVFINDISKEETKKADRISSNYMIDTVDRTIRGIELSILETVQSQQAYRLYFSNRNQNSSDTVYAIAQSLRELTNSSSWIQSIYLYDKRNKHVLTVSGSREAEGFSDKAWIDQMGTCPGIRYGLFSTYPDSRINREQGHAFAFWLSGHIGH